ncbi:MAG TPA: S-methyl-5-thioribose-1-phosphate isomerase, partial [Aggregatilineales bacterium]|nr:S-methyl-5-thioribose-1-phosphate isomerase [Aggregatilineales bacterium]
REVAAGITDHVIRGAPAIAAAAAFGMVLAARQSTALDMGSLLEFIDVAAVILKKARSTVPRLAWSVDRMQQAAHQDIYSSAREIRAALLDEAQRIADEDIATNKALGAHGLALIREGDTVLHHGSTGALTTVDYGTALGVIRAAWEHGTKFKTMLTESRPRLHGARLAAWELKSLGIPFDVIPDAAAGYFMRSGAIQLVLVGADQIAANGDTINTIGTYPLAVLAREHRIPFYVVAPIRVLALEAASGDKIEIQERPAAEVRSPSDTLLMPGDYPVRNPASDLTPQRYLAGIVTEKGIILPPFRDNLGRLATSEKRD